MNAMTKKLVGYVGLVMSLSLAAQAGQYWWDADGAGANLGGSGNWDTGSSLWRTPGATDALTTWNNDGAQDAVFTNAGGTVTLGATAIKVNKMKFIGSAQNWTFNSGTLDFGSNGSVAITNDDHVTINSGITGSGTLTLTTSKSTWARGVSLSGNNSAFTGKMSFQRTAGSYFFVWVNNDFNFGAVPGVYTSDALTLDGVTLCNSMSSNVINVPVNRGIRVGSGGLTVWNSALSAINLNSVITGTGELMMDASTGVINLNAANTWTGITRLWGGKIVIGTDNAFPHGPGKNSVYGWSWNSQTTVDLNGHTLTINYLLSAGGNYEWSSGFDNSAVGPATLVVGDNNANGGNFYGVLKNSGGALSLTKIGTGSQTFSGTNNTYTGATTVNNGTLVVDLVNRTNDVLPTTSSLVMGGGTLNIKGKNSGTSSQALGNLTVRPSLSTISLTPNGGSGTALTLGNTWTRHSGGTLLVDISAAGSTVSSSPTLTNGIIGGYAYVKDGTGTGFATVSGGNLARYTGATVLDATAAAANLDSTVNYVVTNAVTLSGGSPTSTQTVNSFFMSVAANPVINQNGRILVVGAGGVISSVSTWSRLTLTGQKMTSGTGDLVFNISGWDVDVGTIVDNGATKVGLTKTGPSGLLINEGNTYSGDTVINQGSLWRGSCIPNGAGKGNLLVNANAFLEMANSSGVINGLSQSTNNTGGLVQNGWGSVQTLTLGHGDASASFSGVISGGGGGIKLVKIGTGIQTLSGANTYAGGTILSNGVLSVSSLSNLGGANAKVTFAGGTLRITGTTFNSFGTAPVTVSGNVGLDIADAGNAFTFTNDVPGTLTKTGNGSLAVSGTVASLVTDSRTRVGGSGSVAAWTLKSLNGGAYTPSGVEAVTGTLTLEGNYTFDLNADGSGDKLTATGAVTMNSVVITIANPANLTDRSKVYTLVQGSSLSGTASLASVLPQDWKLKKEGNALVVRYVSPGTMVSFL